MMILVVVLIFIFIVLVYYFPLQRILAESKYELYATQQGVNETDVISKTFQKDYKQGGYFISIAYKSDPNHQYKYHYFLLDYRTGGMKVNTMYCYVFDMNNEQLDEFSDTVYKPLN